MDASVLMGLASAVMGMAGGGMGGYDRGYGIRPQARYAGYGTMVCATMRGSCRGAAAYPGQSCGCQDASGRYVPGIAR